MLSSDEVISSTVNGVYGPSPLIYRATEWDFNTKLKHRFMEIQLENHSAWQLAINETASYFPW